MQNNPPPPQRRTLTPRLTAEMMQKLDAMSEGESILIDRDPAVVNCICQRWRHQGYRPIRRSDGVGVRIWKVGKYEAVDA